MIQKFWEAEHRMVFSRRRLLTYATRLWVPVTWLVDNNILDIENGAGVLLRNTDT